MVTSTVALLEGHHSIPSTHVVAHAICNSTSRGSNFLLLQLHIKHKNFPLVIASAKRENLVQEMCPLQMEFTASPTPHKHEPFPPLVHVLNEQSTITMVSALHISSTVP